MRVKTDTVATEMPDPVVVFKTILEACGFIVDECPDDEDIFAIEPIGRSMTESDMMNSVHRTREVLRTSKIGDVDWAFIGWEDARMSLNPKLVIGVRDEAAARRW